MSESLKTPQMLAVQIRLFRRFFEESRDIIALKDKQSPTHAEILAVGSTLQAFYNGIERILTLCARAFGDFEDSKKAQDAWHQWLLYRMANATKLRPAMLSEELYLNLLDYLKFRHVFRQAYVFELRWSLIVPLLRNIEDTYQRFVTELESFRTRVFLPKPVSPSQRICPVIEDSTIIEVRARTLPEAWENAVVACWQGGAPFKTEYDKPGDPPSRDAVARIIVYEPFAEPRIHRAIPAGLADLEIYRQEVLFGVHDNWIDPKAGKWEYTYHERLFEYRIPGLAAPVNQIEALIDKLAATPYTRRAQAVTWQCWQDMACVDPACLQRMWFRVQDDKLLLNVSMRSNDAFKAAFMNMYAFTDMQRWVAERLSEKMGRPIAVGRYIHSADSFHIYGSYFKEFMKFLEMCANKDFSERVLDTADVQYFLDEGKIILFNNTQSSTLLPVAHLRRLWTEIPEDRRGELDAKHIERMKSA